MCSEQSAGVAAEGIETVPELNAVIDAGVHFGRGKLLAKPTYPIPAINWPGREVEPVGR